MSISIEAQMLGITDEEIERLCRERISNEKYFVILYWTKRRNRKEGFMSTSKYNYEELRDVRDLICLEFANYDEAEEYLMSCIENHGYVWADDVDDEE